MAAIINDKIAQNNSLLRPPDWADSVYDRTNRYGRISGDGIFALSHAADDCCDGNETPVILDGQ